MTRKARGGGLGGGGWVWQWAAVRGRVGWAGRGLGGLVSVVLVVGLVVVMGRAEGFSVARVGVVSGQAWVVSAGVGQVALIDGGTEQVVAAVPVARAGEGISLVQGGADALVVDPGAGSVVRVRGATYAQAPGPVRVLAGAGAGLRVFAGGGGQVFAVDAIRGMAVRVDQASMQARGPAVSLAARLSAEATVVDGQGRLWAVDTATGDLVWFDRSGKHVRRGAAAVGRGTRLVLVQGAPAIVDVGRRQVSLLDPGDGRVHERGCLDVAVGASIGVGGSGSGPLVFAVAPERGVLLVSDVKSAQCTRVVSLTAAGARLGDPVESGGRVFVPDYDSGQVFVVNLSTDRVVGSPQVLPSGLRSFDLIARDGFVFYNDPSSQRSGVVRLDATIKSIAKYDPAHPGNQIRRPTRETPLGSTAPDHDGSKPLTSTTPTPETTPSGPTTATPTPETTPSGPTTATPTPETSAQGSGNGETSLRISSSRAPYLSGRGVTFAVRTISQGARVESATWAFGGGSAPLDGVHVTQTWTKPGRYRVNVSAVLSRGPIRWTESTSAPIVVLPAQAAANIAPKPVLRIAPSTGTAPLMVTADAAESTDPDGSISTYAVDWGDGAAQTVGTNPRVTHVYPTACQGCQVRLIVTDNKGLSAAAAVPLTVQPPADTPPTAVLKVDPGSGRTGQDVTADATGSTDAEGPLAYQIVWGDGSDPASTPTATHRYTSAGTYTITLTVHDSAGQEATDAHPVTIQAELGAPTLHTDLSISPAAGHMNLSVQATVSSTGGSPDLTETIDWGDGHQETVSSASVAHVYQDPCSCTATLTVQDSSGQSSTSAATVTVAALAYGPDTCVYGYVWREAFSGDHVCATGAVRSQAADDNAHAAERVQPGGGDYGPDTCVFGYVWREARPSDHVCVTGDVRSQAADDNAHADERFLRNAPQ